MEEKIKGTKFRRKGGKDVWKDGSKEERKGGRKEGTNKESKI